MGAKMPALTQTCPFLVSQVALGVATKDRICWAKVSKHGNQPSTVFGHHLSMRTCSACFLGMPAKFGGPGVGVYKPRAWSKLGAAKVINLSVTARPRHLMMHTWSLMYKLKKIDTASRRSQSPNGAHCLSHKFQLFPAKIEVLGAISRPLPQAPGPPGMCLLKCLAIAASQASQKTCILSMQSCSDMSS
eukprot:1159065-Pelagomonas_calceolata.AAC.4